MLTTTATTTQNAQSIDLKTLNVTVVVDTSRSMIMYKDTPTGKTRWEFAKEYMSSLIGKFAPFVPPGGLNVIFFNRELKVFQNVEPTKFDDTYLNITPDGGTYLGPALQKALDFYPPTKLTETKHLVIVLTDGEPEDQRNAMNVISEYTQGMYADEQVGILIARVGKDPDAKKFTDTLDNGLNKANGCSHDAKFDIVHCEPIEKLDGETAQAIADITFND